MWKSLFMLGGLIYLLVGCASVDLADINDEKRALEFNRPQPGYGSLYVLRDSARGQTSVLEVSVNGLPIAKTAPKTFVQLNLKEGRYYVGGRGENYSQIELNVNSGRTYFIRQVVTAGWNDFRNELEMLPDDMAKGIINDLKMAKKIARDHDVKPIN
jgi:hypothetical protein